MRAQFHRAGVRRVFHTACAMGVACVVLSASLAACSSGSKNSAATSSASASAPASGGAAADAATTTAVTNAFVTFFNGKAPTDQRIAVLQGADAFASSLSSTSSGANLISETSATVSAVTTTGTNQAKVTYTVSLNGTAALPNQTGYAVQINGTWKVAAATFCALLMLQGAPPAACSNASVTALPS